MAQAAIKDQPAYFQGEEIYIVQNDKAVIEKQVKTEQQPDGDKVKTTKEVIDTPNKKEIHTKTETVQPDPHTKNDIGYTGRSFDPVSMILWAAIIGSVIFFIFRHKRNRDRETR